ncbi:ABC transporter substrate-binding protein, partial [Streptomyces alkaliphilus]
APAGAAVLTGLLLTRDRPRAGGPLPRHVIGLHADLSGPTAGEGRAQENGARVAVDEHNTRPDRSFDLALLVRDDGGDGAGAAEVAGRFAADGSVAAVIGPTSDEAAEAAVPVYDEARLPVVAVSVATTAVSSRDHDTFFRLRFDEGGHGRGVIAYLTRVEPCSRVAVIEDGAASNAIRGITGSLLHAPPSRGSVTVHPVRADVGDFAVVVAAALAEEPEAVVLAADSPERAARFARALHEADFSGPRVTTEPVMGSPGFSTGAGEAAEGWVFTTSFVDPTAHPGAEGFATAYRERFHAAGVPPRAAEAYDALRFLARGLEGPETAAEDLRHVLRRRLWSGTHEGVTRTIAFHREHRSLLPGSGHFFHVMENGRPRYGGPLPVGGN